MYMKFHKKMAIFVFYSKIFCIQDQQHFNWFILIKVLKNCLPNCVLLDKELSSTIFLFVH